MTEASQTPEGRKVPEVPETPEAPAEDRGDERKDERGEVRGEGVAARGGPAARGERDDLSGHRMLNIEPGQPGQPGEGAGEDELALRRLFHSAVDGLEPSTGALDHLRRAVPARRARKRQALVGVAAAVVLIGTAVPAFVHVANSGGVAAADPVNAGHGEQAQGGTGTETGVEGGAQSTKTPAGGVSPSQAATDGTGGDKPAQGSGGGQGPGRTGGAAPGSAPRCAADQLGVSAAEAGGPGSDGAVYGTFRIANVSGRACVVDGSGSFGFEARGAADPSRISIVRHSAGDAAGGLPDPGQESSSLLLRPNGSYEVRFAWVPSETCPTTGPTEPPTEPPTEEPTTPPPTAPPSTGTGNPEPTATTGDGSTGETGSGGGSGGGSGSGTESGTGAGVDGAAPQLFMDGPSDGSVSITHTTESGGATASATVPNACAGTIYRTGLLATS